MHKSIYLDNAATTQIDPEVVAAMEPYLREEYGNPSSTYDIGEQAKAAIERARNKMADILGANPEEIYFTSGGTESDNWAIKGSAQIRRDRGNHIITSEIEHHAVLNSCNFLSKMGVETSYARPDSKGIIDWENIAGLIKKNTILISIMHGNNEIGTIEPIREIAGIARKRGILMHTDAVQTMGHIPINLREMPVDMLSASAHKFNGPKGSGFLFVRRGIELPEYIHGGAQERGKRAGTENVAGIVGMGKALELAWRRMAINVGKVREMRNYMVRTVLNQIDGVIYNGHERQRLPGNVSFSFKGIDAQMLLILLSEEGIYASAGSACNSDSRQLSHVIKSIKVPKEYAPGTIRFSIDHNNTMGEIEAALGALKKSVSILRMV